MKESKIKFKCIYFKSIKIDSMKKCLQSPKKEILRLFNKINRSDKFTV